MGSVEWLVLSSGSIQQSGWTALDIAVELRDTNSVYVLLYGGANCNLKRRVKISISLM